ncbi:chymosin-like [Planococcus citri]|uniref:chymosin-like n=1 Tax=Planococcus citri TaxID=170843 RepID=UPI0031F7D93D
MKSFCLLPPILLVFIVSIHQIAGNGIRVPLSKYEPGDEVNGQGFYGTISIGTPPQKINVLFDWKTNGIWMLSSYCNDSVCRAQNHSTYNHKISTTFRGEDDFDTKIWQHPGEATDTITIGNIQTQNVSFFVTTSSEEFNSTPYDGFVGLGRESDFIHRHCEKLGFKRKFSLYIQDNSTSELMLCGEDKTKFQGNLKYITTDGQQFSRWNVAIQSILLHRGDKYVLEMQFDDARRFALDPTSSYITGPNDVIAKIYNELNTRTSKIRDDLKEVDCKHIHTLPNITFRAADNNFTLTGNDYIKQVTHNDERVCIVQFVSHEYSELWIIGNVFNRKFYTVFDVEMQRIGFAERIHDGSA